MDIEQKLQEAIVFHQSGQLQRAEQIYQQVLQISPRNADALNLLGFLAYQVGRCEVAANLIAKAIEVDSKQYIFFINLGLVRQEQGELDKSIEAYYKAIEINPNDSDVYNNLGNTLQEQGELDKSIETYHKAIEINPNDARIYYNLGAAQKKQGKLDNAIQTYQQAIEINPDDAEIYNSLGTTLQKQEKLDQAIQVYRRALEINPNYSEAFYNLGLALQEQGELDQAIQAYHRALEINPNYSEAYNNLGIALKEQENLDDAIQVYHRALEINPNYSEAYNNLGNVLKEQGKLDDAVLAYRSALGINPDYSEAHNNLGLVLLLQGNFSSGWREYEWRLKCKELGFFLNKRDFPQVLWNGSDLNGKTILVWAEQGIGDEIMLASMLPTLLKMNSNIIVECDKRLVPLFQRSFPFIQFVPREDSANPKLLDTTIDYQIPMGSLGQWLRADKDAFLPKQESYLQACPNRVGKLQEKYRSLAGDKLLVGISWKSTGIDKKRAQTKNAPLKHWTPILSQKDCYFVNLQYGNIREEIEAYTTATGYPVYIDEEIDPLSDLDGFAAQVSVLDLIVSTSNTTVHMSGGLGKKVWVLLSSRPDWRWMLEEENTPWYQTVRLFRQEKSGDWEGVFQRISSALKQDVTDD
ncbi:MAG: tetratricopeptide repeat protein [Candidatus Poribacteria bacterium]|nr:tetratricopeptide repeat protein [Candidatus Poribacteria bacterium]